MSLRLDSRLEFLTGRNVQLVSLKRFDPENFQTLDALYDRELQTTLQGSNVHSFHLKANLFSYFSIMFDEASIKPGTRNIPEHSGTCRNMPEHEKIKVIFMKKKIKLNDTLTR